MHENPVLLSYLWLFLARDFTIQNIAMEFSLCLFQSKAKLRVKSSRCKNCSFADNKQESQSGEKIREMIRHTGNMHSTDLKLVKGSKVTNLK